MSDITENNKIELITTDNIKNKIYTIRRVQVMLDSDLATIYGYSTKAFNQQVKRNIEKFPSDFMFQLNKDDLDSLSRSQNVTSMQMEGIKGGRVYYPYVFTEQGIYMLMTILKNKIAVEQSIKLIRTFREMRHFIVRNNLLFQRLDRIEINHIEFKTEVNKKFKEIFKHLEHPKEIKAVMFFKGQMYEASTLIKDLIISAKSDIILIDNYTDRKTLDCFVYKKKETSVAIYTQKDNCKILQSEIDDFNLQYGGLTLNYIKDYHDRFLIIDKAKLYHIGASLKDAGKKAFAISEIEDKSILNSILFVESFQGITTA